MIRNPARDGIDQIWAAIDELKRNQRSARGNTSSLSNATITEGGLTITGGGSLLIEGGGGFTAKDQAILRFLHDTGVAALYMGPMYFGDGSFAGRGLAVQAATGADVFRASSDAPGYGSNVAIGASGEAINRFDASAYEIVFSTARFALPSIPTTGSAANVRFNPTSTLLEYVTSSERYKTDVAEAVIDIDDVMQLQPKTWVDKGSIDRTEPGDIRRDVGFIAEDLDALPSMRQFVDYDDEGRPDAVQYDRLTAATLALVQHQAERIDAQQAQIDALSARLDAIEAA